jgi:hypothetical protein
MMPWYRAASFALLFFAVVFGLVTFTFKGTREMYVIDLVFWGAILRPQEVSVDGRSFSFSPVAEVKDVDVSAGRTSGSSLWGRGISVDKPDLFRNFVFTVDEGSLRFAGQRVELDEPQDVMPRPDNDVPQPAPVKMRLEPL